MRHLTTTLAITASALAGCATPSETYTMSADNYAMCKAAGGCVVLTSGHIFRLLVEAHDQGAQSCTKEGL